MTNLLKQAINCDDGDRAARIIIDALNIETEELANFCLKHWPSGTQGARSHHRPLAPCGGGIPGLMMRCFPPP